MKVPLIVNFRPVYSSTIIKGFGDGKGDKREKENLGNGDD